MSGQGAAATLNLQTAAVVKKGQIVLHFNPRRGAGCIVRNSWNGRWDREERSGGYPFQNEHRWSYELTMRDTSVDIAVDGKRFGTFHLRNGMRIHSVTCLYFHNHHLQDRRSRNVQLSIGGDDKLTWRTEDTFKLPRALRPSDVIRVSGRGEAATLNLESAVGRSQNQIALHFNPRRREGCVVRNSWQPGHGCWDWEERSGPYPFQNAQRWSYELTMRDSSVDMVADGKPFGTFRLRGGMDIRCIKCLLCNSHHPGQDRRSQDVQLSIGDDKLALRVGEVFQLPRALRPSDVIRVSGRGAAATLNLQTAAKSPQKEIALHFNPRRGQGCVVRNSWRRQCRWGPEERSGPYPFKTKKRWSYELTMRDSSVDMVADGKAFGTFRLRGGLGIQCVDHFSVIGANKPPKGYIVVKANF